MIRKIDMIQGLIEANRENRKTWAKACEDCDFATCRIVSAAMFRNVEKIRELMRREPTLIERIYGWIFGGQWVREA